MLDSREVRANSLLIDHLSPHQRWTWHKDKFFYVRGRFRGHTEIYALYNGYNLLRIDSAGRPRSTHGLSACEDLSLGDLLLVQKLVIETDLALVHTIACSFDIHSDIPLIPSWCPAALWNADFYPSFIEGYPPDAPKRIKKTKPLRRLRDWIIH